MDLVDVVDQQPVVALEATATAAGSEQLWLNKHDRCGLAVGLRLAQRW